VSVTESILQEAERLVNGPRQADYGTPLDNWSRTAALWSAYLGVTVTAEQAAMCMVLVKVAREANRPNRDNLVDGAGYFGVVEKIQDGRKKALA
jgi:hypothetical protein